MGDQKVSAIRCTGQRKKEAKMTLRSPIYKEITRSGNNQKFYWGLSVGERKAGECHNYPYVFLPVQDGAFHRCGL